MAHALQRSSRPPGPSGTLEPRLLIGLEPRLRAFLSSAGTVLSFQKTARPAWELEFSTPRDWRDVLLPAAKPWAGLLQSAVFHVLVIATVWTATTAWLERQAMLQRNFFRKTTLTYYHVSPYLPPLEPAGEEPAAAARKGDPAMGRQRITSTPRLADNRRQTLITPPRLKLDSAVALPNLVAWTPSPGPVPVAGDIHSRLTLPSLPVAVIAPPPEAARRMSAAAEVPRAEPVAPAPDASGLAGRLRAAPQTAAEIVPPPVAADASRPLGTVSIVALEPTVSAPQLPVTAQPSIEGVSRPAGGSARNNAMLQPAPVAPGVNSAAAQQLALGAPAGRMIALSLDPAAPGGAIVIPEGNRRGSFAADPNGHSGGGAPELAGGGSSETGGNARGQGVAEGISIARGGPVLAGTPVVAGTPAPSKSRFESLPSLMAMARPNLRGIPRRAPAPHNDIPAEEAAVFGRKRYYSMMLNMPNLNSAAGTCIIRFAELKESAARGELTAPIATEKVDPAYPAELMRNHVEGTVTLYAVIRSNGSVADVRVLSGVDDRLDRYAREALAQWRFVPATRNGSAVDLEAVIRIPFLTRKPGL